MGSFLFSLDVLSNKISEVFDRNEAKGFVDELMNEYKSEDFSRISIILVELVDFLLDVVQNLKSHLDQEESIIKVKDEHDDFIFTNDVYEELSRIIQMPIFPFQDNTAPHLILRKDPTEIRADKCLHDIETYLILVEENNIASDKASELVEEPIKSVNKTRFTLKNVPIEILSDKFIQNFEKYLMLFARAGNKYLMKVGKDIPRHKEIYHSYIGKWDSLSKASSVMNLTLSITSNHPGNRIKHIFLTNFYPKKKEMRDRILKVAKRCKYLEVLELNACPTVLHQNSLHLMITEICNECKLLSHIKCKLLQNPDNLETKAKDHLKDDIHGLFTSCERIHKMTMELSYSPSSHFLCFERLKNVKTSMQRRTKYPEIKSYTRFQDF